MCLKPFYLTMRFYLTARVYRQTDGQTDARTGWFQYTPLTSLRGYNDETWQLVSVVPALFLLQHYNPSPGHQTVPISSRHAATEGRLPATVTFVSSRSSGRPATVVTYPRSPATSRRGSMPSYSGSAGKLSCQQNQQYNVLGCFVVV